MSEHTQHLSEAAPVFSTSYHTALPAVSLPPAQQQQHAGAVTGATLDAQVSSPPLVGEATARDVTQPVPPSQVYSNEGHFGDEEDDTAADQRMLETLEGGSESALMVDEVDARSVFVGNVDYAATPPELQEHFRNCGPINRITIMIDRFTGHPKGYAYIEFQDESAMLHAVSLNQTIFRDRPLKVTPKRKNMPGMSNRGRGGGFSGRGGLNHMVTAGPQLRGRFRGRGRGTSAYFPRYRGRGQRGGAYPY